MAFFWGSDPLYLVHRVRPERWFKLKSCGLQYWKLKLRLAIHTCYSRCAMSYLPEYYAHVINISWFINWMLSCLELVGSCVTSLIAFINFRMHATGKATSRTLVLSDRLICAQRLWNSVAQRKLQYATLPPLLSHVLSMKRWGLVGLGGYLAACLSQV